MKSISDYMKVLENIEMSETVYTVKTLIEEPSKFDPQMPVKISLNM